MTLSRKIEKYSTIEEFYEKELNIPKEMVDILCDYDIIELCVKGLSTETISRHLDISIEEIEKVLHNRLSFGGWSNDLDVNPLMFFDRNSDWEVYLSEIKLVSPVMTDVRIGITYDLCELFDKLRKEVSKYYGS